MRKSRFAALVLPAALLLGACGGGATIAQSSEKSLAQDGLSKVTSTPPKSIDCPSGVSAKVGVTLDCHLTLGDGTKVTFTERVDAVNGNRGRLRIIAAKRS